MKEKPKRAHAIPPWEGSPHRLNNATLAGCVNAELQRMTTSTSLASTFAALEQSSSNAMGTTELVRKAEKRMTYAGIGSLVVAALAELATYNAPEQDLSFITILAIMCCLFEVTQYVRRVPQLRREEGEYRRQFRSAMPASGHLEHYRRRHGTTAAMAKVIEMRVMLAAQAALAEIEEERKRGEARISARMGLSGFFDSPAFQESVARLQADVDENHGSLTVDSNVLEDKPQNEAIQS